MTLSTAPEEKQGEQKITLHPRAAVEDSSGAQHPGFLVCAPMYTPGSRISEPQVTGTHVDLNMSRKAGLQLYILTWKIKEAGGEDRIPWRRTGSHRGPSAGHPRAPNFCDISSPCEDAADSLEREFLCVSYLGCPRSHLGQIFLLCPLSPQLCRAPYSGIGTC